MSLINQMLRDLDKRHAQSPAPSGSAAKLRSASPSPAPARRTPLLWAVAGAVAGGAVVWLSLPFLNERAAPPAPVTPPPVMPPPVATPAAVPAPVPAPVAEPVVEPAPPPKEEPAPIEPPKTPAVEVKPSRPPGKDSAKPPRAAGTEPQLRLETGLGSPKKSERAPEVAPPPVAALAAPKPSAAKPDAAPEGRIDKSQRGGNETAETEYRKAIALVKRGAVTEATTGFLVALRIDPRHVQARQALLSQLVEQRQLPEALGIAEEGLGIDPTQAGWAMLAARLYMERGEPTMASDVLGRHAKHAEGNGDYAAFQALLFQRFKRYREAAERYQAALAVRADEGRWWYGLGLALEGEHKAADATAAFRKAREAGNLPPELAQSAEQRLR